MQFDYRPQHLIKFLFNSDQLINIRITVNDQLRIIQCRNEMMFTTPMALESVNVISIENLTTDAVCKIEQIHLNYLNLMPISHQLFTTFDRQSMTEFGKFVSDLYSPDIAVMTINSSTIYKELLPLFRISQINWSGVQESNPHS